MVHTTESTTVFIHKGYAFDVSGVGTISAGQSVYFLGKTGNIPVHFHGIKVDASQGPLSIEFYEAPTISSNGTLKATPNRSRASVRTSKMLVYTNPTVTSAGTLLTTSSILQVGGGAHESGGTAGINGEWVLNTNTDYLIKLTNNASSTTSFSAAFFYYETDIEPY